MPELFTAATLTALSGRPCTDEQADAIEAWVLAVLTAEIGELPDPLPAGVAAVALELGRGAVPSPGGVASTTIGPYSATYAGTATGGGVLTRDQRMRVLRSVGRGKAFDIDTTLTVPPTSFVDGKPW